jgi:DNA mismatch repair ATPase MutS
MSAIVDKVKPGSLVLFNESFASTNEREGSEIAINIVRALLDRRVKMVFVTHLYHFASTLLAGRLDAVKFLRAERRPDGTRPFKLIEAEPLRTSYGVDLYKSVFGDDSDDGERREERTRSSSASGETRFARAQDLR